jgi:hypothetical protein
MTTQEHIKLLQDKLELREEKKRKDFLVSQGLGKIIFGENVTEPNSEFPEKEFEGGVWTGRCFKYDVPTITEAEYQKIVLLQNKLSILSPTPQSAIGDIFRAIGWILLVVGVVAAFLFSIGNNLLFAITIGISISISSLFFFGFGEIIILLNKIKNKLNTINVD